MRGDALPSVTDLAETAAIYAVCEGNHREALRILSAMTSRERDRYGDSLRSLLALTATADRADNPTT